LKKEVFFKKREKEREKADASAGDIA